MTIRPSVRRVRTGEVAVGVFVTRAAEAVSEDLSRDPGAGCACLVALYKIFGSLDMR